MGRASVCSAGAACGAAGAAFCAHTLAGASKVNAAHDSQDVVEAVIGPITRAGAA